MQRQNFDNWNEVKISVDDRENRDFYINTREVWNVNLGKNIGYESYGKGQLFTRPVLVIKIVGSVVFVASMTTMGKDNKFYHKLSDKYFDKQSYITLSQVRILDKKRFIEKIGMIHKDDFEQIKKELKKILF
ncbi:MAG: type II toxin-antitoxin system PemK/MazF family toxin [Candidatus Gracilibacteria bacterium]|nr:type II toxin-antitoxin system PemK/MazF family toxin [Candidatus Gracilibacteria bacterium]